MSCPTRVNTDTLKDYQVYSAASFVGEAQSSECNASILVGGDDDMPSVAGTMGDTSWCNVLRDALWCGVGIAWRYQENLSRQPPVPRALAVLESYRLLVLWEETPPQCVADAYDSAWGTVLPDQGSGLAEHHVCDKIDTPLQRTATAPAEKLYTLDQLRQAWGAGAWAARRGRA